MKKLLLSFLVIIALIFNVVGCSMGKTDESTESNIQAEDNIEAENDTVTEDVYGKPIQKANGESYLEITEQGYKKVENNPIQTVSLKVDTASYRNIVRHINYGQLIEEDGVRIEEMLNYFNYEEDTIKADGPFSTYMEVGKSPLNEDKHMVFIRTKTKDVEMDNLEGTNLVFLIDTSGSMNSYDKLGLLKSSFKLLVDTIGEKDTVSIVTYAGSSDVVLNGVSGDEKIKIIDAINTLEAGGSTAGAEGILTAYEIAKENFIEDGNNRVILATDGDFNVGVSSEKGLENLISEQRESGVYLSILGFGSGNLQDSKMETLSKHGNGNYSYIDNIEEAKKVLVNELTKNLYTVANDVKMQVEFNDDVVYDYRIIGYENRIMNNEDFDDDKKDAGEIGVGTDTVALFEITLKEKVDGFESDNTHVDDELLKVRVRYKNPNENDSNLFEVPVLRSHIKDSNTKDFNFAVAVAEFGLLLRNSEYIGDGNINHVLKLAEENLSKDKEGYRKEFLEVANKYKQLID